ncbi:isoprenylcysteine carboxylmethyltransferase family protein [Alcaligenaceae bacterium CGII-47]|nr:isoprenylcysteine carboxylmethyltransferase family protein [Alcaligenaceae bacterium CGII-47]
MTFLTHISKRAANSAKHDNVDAIWAHLAHAQVIRRYALTTLGVAALAALIWVGSAWSNGGWVHEGLEWIGLGCLIIAILGRCACMLYLGGRKGADLVSDGPYSVSRNPLYVFSVLAVFGIGLQTGSLVVGLVLALAALAIFRWIIGKEEQLLRAAFGPQFDNYCAQVPRFWPRPRRWHSSGYATVDLASIWRTLRDAAPYFLAIPIFEVIDVAQQAGWIHVRLWLL